jgi:hypothetical protein
MVRRAFLPPGTLYVAEVSSFQGPGKVAWGLLCVHVVYLHRGTGFEQRRTGKSLLSISFFKNRPYFGEKF